MIKLVEVQKYYSKLPHQTSAVKWLGDFLLKTPAKTKLNLTDNLSWISLPIDDLNWLDKQISDKTKEKLTLLWRADKTFQDILPKYFSQRDNTILPFVTCSSSSHAMLVDYYLRVAGKEGLSSDEDYLKKVFSGKYGKFGNNPSVSWEIQERVVESYGLTYNFEWTGNYNKLKTILEEAVACINIYHKGTTEKTRGGGHVILALDVEENGDVLVLDPYGSKPNDGYKDVKKGNYKFSSQEFRWRWQGGIGSVDI